MARTPNRLYESELTFADEHRAYLVGFLYTHHERSDFMVYPLKESPNIAVFRGSKRLQAIAEAYLAGLERGMTREAMRNERRR